MADPTVVVDNLHVVYRVYGAGGNKGTAATSLMRLVIGSAGSPSARSTPSAASPSWSTTAT